MLQILPKMETGQAVTLDGFLVPRVQVHEDPESGLWNVIYDGRFAVTAKLEELQQWLWLVAQAQAVGEGYSCHGANSVYRPNPHRVRVFGLSRVHMASTDTPEG